MEDNRTNQSTTVCPLPKFYFQVEWDSEKVSFQEVSGLDIEAQVAEYRHSNSPHFSTIKMQGIIKSGLVTMKKGVFKSDNKFWAWFNEIKMNTIKQKTLTIKLLDETGVPTMTWILAKAWPTEITVADMKSDGNEVMVESIVFAHEGVTIANA
jgi:phage tail-like protein